MEILNERPEGMDFADYKAMQKFQKAWIKNHKKGRFYYIASEVLYVPEDIHKEFGYVKTYPAFIGKTKDLIYPV